HSDLVGERPDGRADRVERSRPQRARAGSPERIGEAMEPAPDPHDRAPFEPPQRERVEIELAFHLWVGGEQHLKAAVELEALDVVRAHPPTDALRRFEDDDVAARRVEGSCAGEPREARSDHGDVYAF